MWRSRWRGIEIATHLPERAHEGVSIQHRWGYTGLVSGWAVPGFAVSCDSLLDRVTAGDVVGDDGGACLLLAMSSSWDCFGCARADGDG